MSGISKDASTPNPFGAPLLAQGAPPRAMWGLVDRKERWSLSWHNAAFLQEKLVSLLLEEFFYKRGYDRRATTAISVEKVMDAVITQLDALAVSAR